MKKEKKKNNSYLVKGIALTTVMSDPRWRSRRFSLSIGTGEGELKQDMIYHGQKVMMSGSFVTSEAEPDMPIYDRDALNEYAVMASVVGEYLTADETKGSGSTSIPLVIIIDEVTVVAGEEEEPAQPEEGGE